MKEIITHIVNMTGFNTPLTPADQRLQTNIALAFTAIICLLEWAC